MTSANLATWTVGDTLPPMTGRLTTDDGTGPRPVNGTGVTAEAHVTMPGQPVIVRPVTVASDGTWSLAWQTGDLSVANYCKVEVQVTFPGGGIETFGPAGFTVKPQLA